MPLRMSFHSIIALCSLLALPVTTVASPHSLVSDGFFLHKTSIPRSQAPSNGMVPEDQGRGSISLRPGAASLFRGRNGGSLFAPSIAAPPAAKLLMNLIAEAEAGKSGYDAVNYGARIKPPKRPTEMTIGEIYAWIKQTPGQPHAIGRYQFIPATLRRLVKFQGVSLQDRFSPDIQDQLAHQLLEEAGLSDFREASMPRETFMLNLAKIWAGLPMSNGRSYYEGYAGNSAVLSWSHFSTEFRRIFPG
ncbi:hypothetical protein SAMN04488118_109125 [Epibacterium ulvae]|uniref:Muramidase (Phage lambda lysozyme) n=1 Tax=Epibacterium ulvae TaxID=1156985 RepID=A0A1G5R8Q2_9RHOB|nr:hypothetical protein [Epibacterium ulvae]SCZ69679.1 hypothetical protein SAMN04488118_109125 [Epibacterium ulvae]